MENNNKNLNNKIDLPKTFDSFSRRGIETDRSVFASSGECSPTNAFFFIFANLFRWVTSNCLQFIDGI